MLWVEFCVWGYVHSVSGAITWAHYVRHRIRIRMEGDTGFCSGSGRKLQW